MKTPSVMLLASAATLVACSPSATPNDQTEAVPSAASTDVAAAAVSAGKEVYDVSCAVCHNTGTDRAPDLAALHTFEEDRVSTALSEGGIMSDIGGSLTAEQRADVIAFVTASPEILTELGFQPPTGGRQPEYRPEFPYPVRSFGGGRGGRPPAWASPPLGDGPWDFETWEEKNVHVSIVTSGLNSPRSIRFLPDGSVFIPEQSGALRIVRNGKLQPEPIRGTPTNIAQLGTSTGFMGVALHPDFENNGFVYLSYSRPIDGDLGANTIFRGRWNGEEIVDGEDIFLSDDVDTYYVDLIFGGDGKLYATLGGPGIGTDNASIGRAQLLGDYAGKTLRLNDDGSIPDDNPFVGVEGANPEIFTLGHRNSIGITVNPSTGEVWESEHGQYGGDEVNILRAGENYGWPIVNGGRFYHGPRVSTSPTKEGMTPPLLDYVPGMAPGGMAFYTGDKFPAWKGDLFIAALQMGQAPRTGHIERVKFNDNWEPIRNEMLLMDLRQRIRDVEQGPDGNLYAITDEGENSVLLRLEPGD